MAFLRRAPIRSERRTVLLAYFFVFLGTGVWLPYVPAWLASLGLTGWQIGAIGATQPALRWVSALALSAAADRWRIRHRLLLAAALAGAVCFLPLLAVRTFWPLMIVLAAIALCHGLVIPTLDAVVIDNLDRVGGDYPRLRVAGSVAFVVGAMVSAPAVVPLLLVVPSLALVPALAGLPRAQRGHAHEARPPWALLTPPLRAFLATAFLVNASCGAWHGFFALHVASLGLPDTLPGLAWGLAVALEIVLFVWGRGVLARFEPAHLVLVTVAVTIVRWAGTAVASSAPLVVGLQLGHAFTFSVFHLAAILLLAKLVPAASSTSGQGLYGFVSFGLGLGSGIALAGTLVDDLGTPRLFAVEAGVAVLALAPALRLARLMHARAR